VKAPGWIQVGEQTIALGGHCGLFIDMPLDVPAPMVGDWVATEAGSRYLVDHVHVVRRTKQAQQKRYQLGVRRLPKHLEPPQDVHVIWLSWYPRGRR
jgi:hypothetical protein